MEGEENLLLPLVQVRHGGEQRADHELRAVIRHGVERIAPDRNPVEHPLDDLGYVRLEPAQAAGREGRHQQPANSGMPLAVHLGDELHAHEFVKLLEAAPARDLRRETSGVGKHFLHVGIAAAHDLGRPRCEHIERRAPRPVRENGARVLFERAPPEVHIDDLGSVEIKHR